MDKGDIVFGKVFATVFMGFLIFLVFVDIVDANTLLTIRSENGSALTTYGRMCNYCIRDAGFCLYEADHCDIFDNIARDNLY